MRTLTFVDQTSAEEDEFLLPGEWDELTAPQLLFLIELVSKSITVEEIKLKMLLFCLNGRIRRINHDTSFHVYIKKKKYDLPADELHAIAEVFEYLFLEENNALRINPLICKNLFPMIRVGWIKLYGPADGLTNLKYQDFAEFLVVQSNVDNSEKAVFDILSELYKRKNNKSSKFWFKWIPQKKKVAILWFYLGCMNRIQELFPMVFVGRKSDGNPADGQMRIIDALAKNDVTKKEKVRKSDLYEALYTMQIAAEENDKLRKKE